MKLWKTTAAALACGLLVVGCGGSGGGTSSSPNAAGFTQLVTFGDSLSDIGTYKVGTVAALGGGKFTVNSSTAKNWTELLAAQYNLPTPCAAQTGLPSVLYPGFTGAAVTNNTACRNYAQGSARVTSAFGPNSLAIQQAVYAAYGGAAGGAAAVTAAANAAGLGLMAVPVVTQMNNHLAAAGGTYSGKELVTVLAGGNDIFVNLNGVSSAAAGGAGAVSAAQFAGWSAAVQGSVAPGGAAATSAATTAAVSGMAQAGAELAAAVKTLVVGKGAKNVVVLNLPDVSQTPFGNSLNAANPGTATLINTMVTSFNSALQSGLSGTAGVLVVDAYTQSRDQIANPAQYGLTNVTTPACSTTSAANPLQGSSLACTAASLITGDTSRYQFADSVHPTPYANQLVAQLVSIKLAAAGWQ